jgi:hypothetical protein
MRHWMMLPLTFSCLLAVLRADEIQAESSGVMVIQNDCTAITIGAEGQTLKIVDRRDGRDYAKNTPPSPFARIRKGGKSYAATEAAFANGRLTVKFGDCGVAAVLQVEVRRKHFIVEVISVSPRQLEELVFVDIPVTLTGASHEDFAVCALALNLKTKVRAIPQATSQLWAACQPRFGFIDAKVATLARISPFRG